MQFQLHVYFLSWPQPPNLAHAMAVTARSRSDMRWLNLKRSTVRLSPRLPHRGDDAHRTNASQRSKHERCSENTSAPEVSVRAHLFPSHVFPRLLAVFMGKCDSSSAFVSRVCVSASEPSRRGVWRGLAGAGGWAELLTTLRHIPH